MGSMEIREILEHIPHRYPFLLVDRVLSCDAGKEITALKNVSINEPFFVGHFPGQPVMPGVLIVEAMAQAAALLTAKSLERDRAPGSLYFLVGIDKARFKKPVVAGDQLKIHVSIVRRLRGVWKFSGTVRVEDNLVAECELMCAMGSM